MRTLGFLILALAACGSSGDDAASIDAPSTTPQTITISGTATKRQGLSSGPAAGVAIAAYQNSDPNTVVAMATTDAAGMYSMTVTTNGPVDGYLKATLTGFIDTYLYAPKPLTADFSSASINMVDMSTLGTLSGTLCGMNQDTAKGVVAVIVADANNTAVAGATVSSTPGAAKYCYNGNNGLPDKTKMMTAADGIGYMINLTPGDVSVTAAGTGAPYAAHTVNARAMALTTTVIQP